MRVYFLALLTGCAETGATEPVASSASDPAAARAAVRFAAEPAVAVSGKFALDRVVQETMQHGMERMGSSTRGITVRLELEPDGTAWFCTTWTYAQHNTVSEYASESGKDEHTERSEIRSLGRGGVVTRSGGDVLVTLSREAKDCDRKAAYDWDNGQVRCTPGRLDGHDAMACEPSPMIGGEAALLPFEARSVLLGRDGLSASYAHRGTTIDPPELTPDPGDPRSWTLDWGVWPRIPPAAVP